MAPAIGQIAAPGRPVAFCIDHHLVAPQKLIGNTHGRHKQTAAVSLKVQDERPGTLGAQVGQFLLKLINGSCSKTGYLYIPYSGSDNI